MRGWGDGNMYFNYQPSHRVPCSHKPELQIQEQTAVKQTESHSHFWWENNHNNMPHYIVIYLLFLDTIPHPTQKDFTSSYHRIMAFMYMCSAKHWTFNPITCATWSNPKTLLNKNSESQGAQTILFVSFSLIWSSHGLDIPNSGQWMQHETQRQLSDEAFLFVCYQCTSLVQTSKCLKYETHFLTKMVQIWYHIILQVTEIKNILFIYNLKAASSWRSIWSPPNLKQPVWLVPNVRCLFIFAQAIAWTKQRKRETLWTNVEISSKNIQRNSVAFYLFIYFIYFLL